MKITTVSYTKTFNLGNYSSEKIGAEVEINEQDNVEHGLDAAKKLVEDFHRKNNPQLYLNAEVWIANTKDPIPDVPLVKTDEVIEEKQILDWIKKCTATEKLSSYKFIARKYESTKLAYLTKEKELSNA